MRDFGMAFVRRRTGDWRERKEKELGVWGGRLKKTNPGAVRTRLPARRSMMIRLSDVRYALRLWRRHPTLVIVAGLSLGLGVGATTTMYSVVNSVANYDLGFTDADRLAVLWSTDPDHGGNAAAARPGRSCGPSSSTATRSRPSASSRAAARPSRSPATTETSRVAQMPVDVDGALDRRRVKPAARAHLPPRGLRRRRQAEGGARDRRQLRDLAAPAWAAAPDVIGTTIHVDGEPRTVIGVMPQGLPARALGGRHRLLGRQRPAQDPARRAG